jgi:hypothetical protein
MKTTIAKLNLNSATDSRVFYRRPDETIYAVLPKSRVIYLRRYRKLEIFLKQQRDSGIILEVARAL